MCIHSYTLSLLTPLNSLFILLGCQIPPWNLGEDVSVKETEMGRIRTLTTFVGQYLARTGFIIYILYNILWYCWTVPGQDKPLSGRVPLKVRILKKSNYFLLLSFSPKEISINSIIIKTFYFETFLFLILTKLHSCTLRLK